VPKYPDWLPYRRDLLIYADSINVGAIEVRVDKLIRGGTVNADQRTDIIDGVWCAAQFYGLGRDQETELSAKGTTRKPLEDVVKHGERMLSAMRNAAPLLNDREIEEVQRIVSSASIQRKMWKFPEPGRPKQFGDHSFIWIMASVCERLGIKPGIGRSSHDPEYRAPFQRFVNEWLVTVDPERVGKLPTTTFYNDTIEAWREAKSAG